ncbi:hypothetical protein L2E82_51126 [Cichorium intybus]|nr:hypothetical protein L2E82_51126 [Cichorium intybus]
MLALLFSRRTVIQNDFHALRTWHENRGGFVRERCSFNKEIEHVKAKGLKICAEFLGGSFNCDAYHMTSTHPVGKLKRMKRLNSPFDHLEYLMLSNIMVLFNMSKSSFLKFIKRAMADALQRALEKAMSHKSESQNALPRSRARPLVSY